MNSKAQFWDSRKREGHHKSRDGTEYVVRHGTFYRLVPKLRKKQRIAARRAEARKAATA